MSGDAQPRKRKDKRRRKEEEELYPNLKDTDEIIHVYKDANTGGNLVTKIIFFFLMGGIAVMVGLILLEHRGTTDEDHDLSAKETPWSLQFDDWSKLLTVPDLTPKFLSGEQGDHDHSGHSGEEHGHEEQESEDDHGQDPDDHDVDQSVQNDGPGWFSFELPSWGWDSGDVQPPEHEVEEPAATSSWFGMSYFGGEEIVEEPAEDLEEPISAEGIDGEPLSEEENDQDLSAEDEQDLEGDQDDDEDEANSAEEQDEEEEEPEEDSNISPIPEDDEPLSEEQIDGVEAEDKSTPDDDEEQPENSEAEENYEPISGEEEEDDDDPRGSVFPRKSSIIEEDEAESAEREEEDEAKSVERDEEDEAEKEEEPVQDASEEELFPEAIEALQREASELIRQQKEAEMAAAVEEEVAEEEAAADEQPALDEEEETEGMALKFGVGVALVVVAHVVLVKKWNSWAEGNEAESGAKSTSTPSPSHNLPSTPSRTPVPTPEPPKSETPLADWAEEAIKSAEIPEVGGTPPRTPSPELEDEEYEEESEPEEEEEEEDLSEDVPPINPKIYEELIAKYGQPSPDSSDPEGSDDGNREYSDGGEVESVGEEESGGELEESEPEEEQRWTNIKKPAEVETGSEGEEEEEEEEESEDEPPPIKKPPQGGARSADEPDDEEMLLRRQLELAEEEFNYERYESALNIYRNVLSSKPQDAQSLYGVAQCLDKMAEQKKSNALLQNAIDSYLTLLSLDGIPETIFVSAAKRAINRLRFRGFHMKAVLVHKKLIEKFNDIVEYRNDLAINYLMVNRLNDAKTVFQETLNRWPDDPVARSHYGLVLKLSGQTAESVPHLQRGLAADHPETRDARLYFHLGDALSRVGQTEEAMKVYKTGVEKGLFRSEYQRSLYNVDHLAGRPWWTKKQTTYEEFFKMLENNWKVIRDEGLSAMKLTGLYQDEAENLRDVGDWKQFQLFARGARYADNCKKTPVTCKIIGDFSPARGCKRGQSKFSVMEGGTHVWPHCGPTNCRLRAHLGLVVPPGPAIRVANETRKWAEGKVIVFDDSFEHEVWHNGTALRLVLIVDVWHPELTPAEKASLSPI